MTVGGCQVCLYCKSLEKPKVSKNHVPALEVDSASKHLCGWSLLPTHTCKAVSKSEGWEELQIWEETSEETHEVSSHTLQSKVNVGSSRRVLTCECVISVLLMLPLHQVRSPCSLFWCVSPSQHHIVLHTCGDIISSFWIVPGPGLRWLQTNSPTQIWTLF